MIAIHIAAADSQLVDAFECLLRHDFISVDDDSHLTNDEWRLPNNEWRLPNNEWLLPSNNKPPFPDHMPAAEWPVYFLRLPGCWSGSCLDPTSAWNLDPSDQPGRSSMFKHQSPILAGILPDLRIYTAGKYIHTTTKPLAIADRIVACWLDPNLVDREMTFYWEFHFMQLTMVLQNLEEEIHDWLPEDAFLLDIFGLTWPRQTLLGEKGMEAVQRGIRGPLFKVAWRKYCLRVPTAQRLPPPAVGER
ncbi:MAG: hypothetical protein M1816_001838 [Peltula sp. TS41687]|nr:MAG: hypothetical protein M1816_001838 [Peltula sp. TS41687]